jgi:hypothetical protein
MVKLDGFGLTLYDMNGFIFSMGKICWIILDGTGIGDLTYDFKHAEVH